MIHAKLTKVGTVDEPLHQHNIIIAGYEVKGFYEDEPTIDDCFRLFRYEKNGEKVFGFFTSSPVKKIDKTENGYKFETFNSIYELEHL